MKRIALALAAAAIVAIAVYWFALRDTSSTTAAANSSRVVAQIGEGKQAILVAGDGTLMGPAAGGESHLPVLSVSARPKGDRVRGHVREEVKVLAAAPRALRRHVAKAGYGKSGVAVAFDSGIEIRFGDDRGAKRKWKAAAAVLADPSVTLLSYVNVASPNRPAVDGEAHELPPAS